MSIGSNNTSSSTKKKSKGPGNPEIEQFLTYLVAEKKVASSTQNQALSALLFLYHQVLDLPIEISFSYLGARRPERLPVEDIDFAQRYLQVRDGKGPKAVRSPLDE